MEAWATRLRHLNHYNSRVSGSHSEGDGHLDLVEVCRNKTCTQTASVRQAECCWKADGILVWHYAGGQRLGHHCQGLPTVKSVPSGVGRRMMKCVKRFILVAFYH